MLGKPCESLDDVEWDDLEKFLDTFSGKIEHIDFLDLIAQLPDDGVKNGIIIDPTRHNRNQNNLLTPLRKRRASLLSQHFDLQNILDKTNQIGDHGEALSYLLSLLRDYDKYHSCMRHNQYSPEELTFCNRIKLEIEYREKLQRSDFERRPTQIMGDNYNIGQAGAVGPNAKAQNITFNQIWNQLQEAPNLPDLAHELSILRQEMKRDAIEAEHDISVSEIAKAEQSAKQGDGPNTLEHLKSAGKWALDIAIKAGVSLAAKTIEQSINP